MSKFVQPVTITLDRVRALSCNMASVAAILEWTGVDLTKPRDPEEDKEEIEQMGAVLQQPGSRNALLAAMLLHDDAAMTPVRAGCLIDTVAKARASADAIQEAIARFFGVPVEQLQPQSAAAGDPTSLSISNTSGPSPESASTSPTPNSGG